MGTGEIYMSSGMDEEAERIECGLVDWAKRDRPRWYGHVRRMSEDCVGKKKDIRK